MLKLVSQNELTASIRLAVDELATTGTEYDLFAALPNGCSELLKQCDRCKFTAEPYQISRVVKICPTNHCEDEVTYDLCDSCARKLQSVLRDGGKQ